MAIIGVLMAVALPAFNTMGRGSNVRSGILQMRTVLTFARQWAITRNERTYVVFPDENSNLGADHIDKAYRAVAVWTESKGFVRDWIYMPKGVVLVGTKASANISSTRISDSLNPLGGGTYSGNVAKRYTFHWPATNNMMPGLFFNPDGSMFNRNSNAEIYLTEGATVVSGGSLQSIEYRPKGSRFLAGIELNQLTGQMRVTDYEGE